MAWSTGTISDAFSEQRRADADPSLHGVRLEISYLHYDGVDWHAYTYAWQDDWSDAGNLVPARMVRKEKLSNAQREHHLAISESQSVHVALPRQSVGDMP